MIDNCETFENLDKHWINEVRRILSKEIGVAKEMEIRKPKFELGQKVVDRYGNVITVIKFNSYHFEDNEYWYDVSYDGEVRIKKESFLKPCIEKSKTVWDLEEGEECYSLTICGNVLHGFWDGSSSSIEIRDTGGIFLTKEEAQYEIERRKVETEMLHLGGRREFKNGENNYYIVCDFDSSHFAICIFNNKSDGFAPMTIYFDSAKECKNAIKTIGEDRIKRYIFKTGISCNEK